LFATTVVAPVVGAQNSSHSEMPKVYVVFRSIASLPAFRG
jgi:hypothetical protein